MTTKHLNLIEGLVEEYIGSNFNMPHSIVSTMVSVLYSTSHETAYVAMSIIMIPNHEDMHACLLLDESDGVLTIHRNEFNVEGEVSFKSPEY